MGGKCTSALVVLMSRVLVELTLFSLLLFILVRTDEIVTVEPNETSSDGDGEFPVEHGAHILNDSNFDTFLEKNPTALIIFYEPDCGQCKEMIVQMAGASAVYKAVPLAKVDLAAQKMLADRFKFKEFPVIKLYKEGEKEQVDYDGERDASGIVHWLRLKTDPTYKPEPEEVVTLTQETFDAFIADKPLVLVEFYAPWCGHCKRLAPQYEKAAKRLKTHDIPLVKVDANVEKKLAEQYGIQGFPTLKVLRYGRRFDYNGPREADGIVQYMLEQSKPAAKMLDSTKAVERFMAPSDVTVVGFFASESGPLFEAFVDAAERTRGDFSVGYVLDEGAMKHFGAKQGQIELYYPEIFWSRYEPKSRTYPKAEATTEELISYWRENAHPLVGQMTRMNSATRYAHRPLVVVYYNVDFSKDYRKGTQYWRNKVVDIANKYKAKKYNFAVADEEEFAKELEAVGLGTSGLEQNVVVFGVGGKKYPMDPDTYDEGLEENLVAFLGDIGKGRAKPFVKSQPTPKEDRNSPIKTLVASNFAAIVNDEQKDVLIEFYAPWCGHCKSFEPKYKQFAAKYAKEEPNLVMAKFDATENDVPENYKVEGFPTLFLAPAGRKDKPVKYSGNRDLDDLLKFIRLNAVKSFQGKGKEEL